MRWTGSFVRGSLCALSALAPLLATQGAMAKPAAGAAAETATAAREQRPGASLMFSDLEMDQPSDFQRLLHQAPQTLNRSEMLNLAKRYDKAMAAALIEGERAKADAIRERDALKLSCIQDRLARMKVTRLMSLDSLTALERRDIQDDELRLRHEFRGVEMATERINVLRQELSQCVGESLDVAYGAEHDQVPTAPAIEPAGTTDTPKIDRPPAASTYQ